MKNPDQLGSLRSGISSLPQETRFFPATGLGRAGLLGAVLLPGLLALVVFFGHWHLERQLDKLQVFAQYDVLFDADPNIRVIGFAHGWGAFNRNLMHPNLANFINPPLRFVARSLQMAGVVSEEVLTVRRSLALLVTPLVSALQALALVVLFRRLGSTWFPALLLALLGSVAFSQLIFGSLPDHFALSNLVLTGAFILSVELARGETIHWPAWLLLGWLAAGITLTNLLIVALLLWVPLLMRQRRWRWPTRQAAILVGIALAVTFVSFHLLNLGYDAEPQPPPAAVQWSGNFWRDDPAVNLRRFPTALADAVAPTGPQAIPIRYLWPRDSRYIFQFTLDEGGEIFSRRNLLGTAVFVLLIAGTLAHLRVGGHRRTLALAALAVLAFNALFHALWGHEYFLYSQHWLTASLFLLAGILSVRPHLQAFTLTLLAALVVAVGMNNLLNLQLVLAALEAFPGHL